MADAKAADKVAEAKAKAEKMQADAKSELDKLVAGLFGVLAGATEKAEKAHEAAVQAASARAALDDPENAEVAEARAEAAESAKAAHAGEVAAAEERVAVAQDGVEKAVAAKAALETSVAEQALAAGQAAAGQVIAEGEAKIAAADTRRRALRPTPTSPSRRYAADRRARCASERPCAGGRAGLRARADRDGRHRRHAAADHRRCAGAGDPLRHQPGRGAAGFLDRNRRPGSRPHARTDQRVRAGRGGIRGVDRDRQSRVKGACRP
ncbi:MAG: hypothetical protein R3D33_10020 [Hyphomicrobiaceae bacterium]